MSGPIVAMRSGLIGYTVIHYLARKRARWFTDFFEDLITRVTGLEEFTGS